MLPTKFQFILYALQAMPLKVFWHDNDFIQVFIIVPDVGNGVGETLHFRQQYLKQQYKKCTVWFFSLVGLKVRVAYVKYEKFFTM
jgi:hypothetical protein